MSIGIVSRLVVMNIAGMRIFRRQLLEPEFKILTESLCIIIDKDAGRGVHCVNKAETLLNTALLKTCLNFRGDI